MKRNPPARLTALLLAALLLLPIFTTAHAQRRRRRAATPAPARQPSTNTPPRSTGPSARADAATPPSAAARRREGEAPVEALLAADAYGVFVEVRKVGRLAQDAELKTALAALRLSGEMPREFNDLIGFITENAEALGEARYVLTMMPARSGVPTALSALQFPTVENAVAFEPKYRKFVNSQLKIYNEANPAPNAPTTRGARVGRRNTEAPKAPELNILLKRIGNCIIIGSEPFTLKRLRGDGTRLLADSVRFQAMRSRFASESLFVYVDTGAIQRGFAAQMEKAQQEAEAMQAAQANAPVIVEGMEGGMSPSLPIPTVVAAPSASPTKEPSLVEPAETPTPEAGATPARNDETTLELRTETALIPPAEGEEAEEAGAATVEAHVMPLKPSESQIASAQLSSLLRGIGGGVPRIPESFSLAVALEGGTVSLRAAVANTPDGAVNLIPFLPNIFNGPAVTSESATLAPADADIFFSTSLEWSRIFNAILAGSGGGGMGGSVMAGGYVIGMGGDEQEETPVPAEAVIEAVEKLFGFKFKEELLPSLGNEIAVSVPLAWLNGPGRYEREREAAEKAEKGGKDAKDAKEAEAGLVVLVALNDAEKVKKILPRVAMAFGFTAPGATAQTERREGFDIQTLGSFSYVIINNHLAIAEDLKAVRHVVDAYSRRQTLDTTNSFRDATAWQARQRIAQVYVSEVLMKSTQEEAKKLASMSGDPLVLGLISQLNTPPEPAAYVATNEGDMLLHEVRLPLGLIKTYAASIMIGVKEAPITSGESMARYALGAINDAQQRFKIEKKHQRFGTLEELTAAGLVEKWVLERQEYKIELTVVGEKFEATATPLNYGKTGRRSFFVDESGIVRAADHQGKPATAQDPPVD